MIDKTQVEELKNLVHQVCDCLDAMDDETYSAVNDFLDPESGRYTDMVEWLQHLYTVR